MQRKWKREGSFTQQPQTANQVVSLTYSSSLDFCDGELYLERRDDLITIIYKYVNFDVSRNFDDLEGVNLGYGPLETIHWGMNETSSQQYYSLCFGPPNRLINRPTNNQADALEFLKRLGRYVSLESIMDELKLFCSNTKINEANSENIKELRETIASQAKQISDLQDVVSRLRNEAEPSTRTARVRMF